MQIIKTYFPLFLLFISSNSLNAQNVYIPDSVFLNNLIEIGYDYNNDKQISYEEASKIKTLVLNPDYVHIYIENIIYDFTGIEALINLEYLDISGNFNTELDLSNHPKLKTFIGVGLIIESITIKDNDALEVLNLNAAQRLISADFSEAPNLKFLDISFSLLDIDLSQNIKLEELYYKGTKGEEIDLLNLPELKILELSQGNIINLDLSGNPNLKNLRIIRSSLENIYFEDNDSLTSLDIIENNLTNLDLSQAPNVESIFCERNKIEEINLTGLKKIEVLQCFNNDIRILDLKGLETLNYVSANGNKITKCELLQNNLLTSLTLSDNLIEEISFNNAPNLEILRLGNNTYLSWVDISKLNNLKEFGLSNIFLGTTVCVPSLPFPPSDLNLYMDNSFNFSFIKCSTNTNNIDANSFYIYPNPTSEIINIRSTLPHLSNMNVKVTDQYGRNVDYNIESQNENGVSISLKGLNQGCHFLSIFSERQRIVEKILIE